MIRLRRVLLVLPGRTTSCIPCFRYEIPLYKRMHRGRGGRITTQRMDPDVHGSIAIGEVDSADAEFARLRGRFRDPKTGESLVDDVFADPSEFVDEFREAVERDGVDKQVAARDMKLAVATAEPHVLTTIRGIGDDIAEELVKIGLDTIEKLATAELDELETVDGIGPAKARKIRDQARDLCGMTEPETGPEE